jgi:hypothetical protein
MTVPSMVAVAFALFLATHTAQIGARRVEKTTHREQRPGFLEFYKESVEVVPNSSNRVASRGG